MGSCLIVSVWTGPRRAIDPRAAENPNFYLRTQVEYLSRVPNSLSRIVFVENINPWGKGAEPPPLHIAGVPTDYITRPNIGISYGAFSQGWEKYRGQYDTFFFCEDDYVFVHPYWDMIMGEWLQNVPQCGALCGLVCTDDMTHTPHPGIAIWASPNHVLEKIKEGRGGLPFHDSLPDRPVDYFKHEMLGQIELGKAVRDAGYEVHDVTSQFVVPFHDVQNKIRLYGERNKRCLFLAVECLTELEAFPAGASPSGEAQEIRAVPCHAMPGGQGRDRAGPEEEHE